MRLQTPAAQDIVIFGASGDLSRRKLLPALYNWRPPGSCRRGARSSALHAPTWARRAFGSSPAGRAGVLAHGPR